MATYDVGKDPIGELLSDHSKSIEFPAAVADLIDNSIDAGASRADVFVNVHDYGPERKLQGLHSIPYEDDEDSFRIPPVAECLHGPQSYAIVLDDGPGMSPETLQGAMVKGRRRKHKEWHHGKYGFGLKQSTRAHAQEVTVITKTEDGELSVRRDSTFHVLGCGKAEVIDLEEIEKIDWMRDSDALQRALQLVNSRGSGTAVVMEGLHKISVDSGAGDPNTRKANLLSRLRSFLGLTFQFYIEEGGADVPISELDDKGERKTVNIPFEIGINNPNQSIAPIDPFEKDLQDDTGYGTLSHTDTVKTRVTNAKTGEDEMIDMEVTMHILPNVRHPHYSERRKLLDATLKETLAEDGTVGEIDDATSGHLQKAKPNSDAQNVQGLFIYRNMRLIDFAGANIWKNIRARDPGFATVYRWEVHLPPGLQVGTAGSSEWTISDSKDDATPHTDLVTRLKRLGAKPVYWHEMDPEDCVRAAGTRAKWRGKKEGKNYESQEAKWAEIDGKKWPCKICNDWRHSKVSHRCSLCNNTGHQGPNDSKCLHYQPPQPEPAPPLPVPPEPEPPSPGEPPAIPETVTLISSKDASVRKDTSVDLIEVRKEGEKTTISVNPEATGFQKILDDFNAIAGEEANSSGTED